MDVAASASAAAMAAGPPSARAAVKAESTARGMFMARREREIVDLTAQAAAAQKQVAIPTFVLRSPALLALRNNVLTPMATGMTVRDWMELSNLQVEADLDWEVIQRMRNGRYSLSYTLTWLQTTSRFSRYMTLAHILKCRDRCALLVETQRVLCNTRDRNHMRQQRLHALRDYMETLCLSDAVGFDAADMQPVTYMGDQLVQAVPPPQTTMETLLMMVREATYNDRITMAGLRAAMHRVFTPAEVNSAARTMHAFSKLARCMATFFPPLRSTIAAARFNMQARCNTLYWLCIYFRTGCTCAR